MGKAARQHVLLPQELLDEDANIQGVELVIANKEDGSIGWDGIQARHDSPILMGGEEDWADQPPQQVSGPADKAKQDV